MGSFDNGVYQLTFDRVFTNISAACVPLFFMVNGALLLNKQYSVEKIYSKAAQIALLVFVWEFTGFPSWFFKTLIVIYLLYPILKKIYDKQILRYLLMLAIFIMPFLYNTVMTIVMHFGFDFSLNILGHEITMGSFPQMTGLFTMYSLLYFFLGGEFRDKKVNPVFSIILAVIGLVVLTIDGVTRANVTGELQDSVNGYFPTIGALMLTFGIFNFCKLFDKVSFINKKAVVFLGKRALTIYLFHVVFVNLVRNYFLTGQNYSSILTLLIAILIFAICILLSLVLERIPLVKNLLAT